MERPLDFSWDSCHTQAMAHHLEALAAENGPLSRIAESLKSATVVPLAGKLCLLPLTDAVKRAASGGVKTETLSEGVALPRAIADTVATAAGDAPVAYIEAHYDVGKNHQAAVVWTGGVVSLGPLTEDAAWDPRENNEDRPVNRALRLLGLESGKFDDEWDAAGLTRHPNTEGWTG